MADRPAAGWFVRSYRVLRWVALAVCLTALLLVLVKRPAPDVAVDADAPGRVEAKLVQMETTLAAGVVQPVALDEAELNGWLKANLALAPAAGRGAANEPSVEEMRSNVRDVKVQLVDDRVRAWVLFDVYGKELTLTLEARLSVQGRSLRLEPIAGWLGRLPVPRAALERGFARALADPRNADKLRLPAHVADVRIEAGRLVITPQAEQ